MRNSTQFFCLVLFCAFVIIVQYFVITYNVTQKIQRRLNLIFTTFAPHRNLPPLYVITPTYKRLEQIAELTRLSHTLSLVPNLTWLVVEDSNKTSERVEEVLKKFKGTYRYMLAPMPLSYKERKQPPKGVSNRNKGLQWLRDNAKYGVFYFADDDNTYDLELFEEIRKTKNVSLFPVGFVTQTKLSTPIVDNCTLVGFYDGWIGGRKFPVDMAGFAVSVEFFLERPEATMPYTRGYEEDGFLRSLAPLEPKDTQLLASCCTKILVWHTKTLHNLQPKHLPVKKSNTNIAILKNLLADIG